MVSVFCISYNHEKTISDCIAGVLKQKTTFGFDITIYDDKSIDRSAEIAHEYERAYPERINVVEPEHNMFKSDEYNWRLYLLKRKLRGKYIAICEADDQWIDRNKLQRQFEYMEEHLDCSLYIHNAVQLNCDDGRITTSDPIERTGISDVEVKEIILQKNGHPPTASFFYRKDMEPNNSFFHRASVFDYTIMLSLATVGKVVYDDRIMSLYRWHSPGSYNLMTQENEGMCVYYYVGLIWFLLHYDRYTKGIYHMAIEDKLQGLISAFVENAGDREIEEYIRMAEETGFRRYDFEADLLGKMEEIRKRVNEKTYIEDDLIEFMESEEVVVMGTGKYAKIISEKLMETGTKIKAYMVSHNKNNYMFEGKKVISTMDYRNNHMKEKVIVAINPIDHQSLKNSLIEAGADSFYNPYEFKWSNYDE